MSIKNSYSTPPAALKSTIVPSQILADAFEEFAEAKSTAVIEAVGNEFIDIRILLLASYHPLLTTSLL